MASYVNALLSGHPPPDKAAESSYYEALGRFIAAYAYAEAEIHTLARFKSGMDDARARLVFSGLRVSDAIDRLRALVKIGPLPNSIPYAPLTNLEEQIIEGCLTQFQIIGEKRDKLVHRMISYDAAGFNVSNGATAKSYLTAELKLTITISDLRSMKMDCQLIYLALGDLSAKEGQPMFSQGVLPTWRYILPPQVLRKPKDALGRRARKRQRRASQAKSSGVAS